MVHPDFDYDEIADKIFFPIFDRIAEQIIEASGKKEGRMLDVGSGGGHLGYAVMQMTDLEGHFVDINPAALEIAEKRAEERGLACRSFFHQENVQDMSFEDGYADLVISRGSYIFWDDQKKAFEEIYRVLAPGGFAYIGAGLGSTDQREAIHKKMDELYGGWKPPTEEKRYNFDTQMYHDIFRGHGWDYHIIDGDEGRWFLIRKG